ncbi:hypothetical protein AaE_012904 [Aphanomyces astaci]|uniref:Uncharacterized protein n=1 Tax=Aphanomyces astaci TaxID=112090 RepID=A0A6A4ZCY5_APHAT|nr:hypothetical protein AaE_012904 [Aphanomyces astaci]
MEEKPLQHAILKYRNLNDRKHSAQPTVNGTYNAAAATTTPDTTAAISTMRKRQPFSYQDHTSMVGQLLGATSAARKSNVSSSSSLNGLYPSSSSSNGTNSGGGLLRHATTSSHHHHHHHSHHSHHHMSPSTTNEGFQYEEAFNRGKKHVEKKDFKRAVSEFSEAISISPNKLKAYIYRGDCYMNTGRASARRLYHIGGARSAVRRCAI